MKKLRVPEILESLIMILQKFCGGPEILDQCFRSDRNAVPVLVILKRVFGVITHCLGS
jgi:hypothetical protein